MGEMIMSNGDRDEAVTPVTSNDLQKSSGADEEELHGWHKVRGVLENSVESLLFASRWILLPLYLGLVIALLAVCVVFIVVLVHYIGELIQEAHIPMEEYETLMVMGALKLLDIALLANLMLLVIFSGYENFVSKIGAAAEHEDRPPWMGHLDFSGLKIKIVGSIVAISLIELLQDFMDMGTGDFDAAREIWRIALHLTFVVSGLIFALMDYWGEKRVTVEMTNMVYEEAHETELINADKNDL
jgi:uncharacterized protein (TIGR00645 family)